MIYILLYIDDMLIVCKDRRKIDKLKSLLEMKDLGASKKVLDIELIKDKCKCRMYLSQE